MTFTQLVLLPGILMPAALRYGPLLAALGEGIEALPKDLEVYADSEPPQDYSIGTEVEGVLAPPMRQISSDFICMDIQAGARSQSLSRPPIPSES